MKLPSPSPRYISITKIKKNQNLKTSSTVSQNLVLVLFFNLRLCISVVVCMSVVVRVHVFNWVGATVCEWVWTHWQLFMTTETLKVFCEKFVVDSKTRTFGDHGAVTSRKHLCDLHKAAEESWKGNVYVHLIKARGRFPVSERQIILKKKKPPTEIL